MKKCFKCGEQKPLSEFYKHSRMLDGHLNKCKSCANKAVFEHRPGKGREKILAYDRERAKKPKRIEAKKLYWKTIAGKAAIKKAHQNYIKNNQEKRIAHIITGNAIRDGKLKKLPCFVCGEKAEAHHPDYSRPLDVIWLCKPHHVETHNIVREEARKK